MFNDFKWGSCLIFPPYSKYQVYVDGRTTVHGQKFLSNYFEIINGDPSWEKEFKQRKINLVLLPSGTKLGVILLHVKDWKIVYIDSKSAVFVRVIPQNYELLKKAGYSVEELKKDNEKTSNR